MSDLNGLSDDFIKNFHLAVGKNVKRIRQERNISKLKLAYMIGYKSVSQISSAEIYYNKIHFNLEQLAKISYVLNIPISEFFVVVDDVVVDDDSQGGFANPPYTVAEDKKLSHCIAAHGNHICDIRYQWLSKQYR